MSENDINAAACLHPERGCDEAILQKAIRILDFSDKWATCLYGVPRYIVGMFGPDGTTAGDKAYVSFFCNTVREWRPENHLKNDSTSSESTNFRNLEFIDILFPNEIIPYHLLIKGRGNETATIRVLGCIIQKCEPGLKWPWTVLWKKSNGQDTCTNLSVDHDSLNVKLTRLYDKCSFTLDISHPHPCNVIRLEVDKTLVEEHEIWCIYLLGKIPSQWSAKSVLDLQEKFTFRACEACLAKSIRLPSLSLINGNLGASRLMQIMPGWFPICQFSTQDANSQVSSSWSESHSSWEKTNAEKGNVSLLERLPPEVLLRILRYLDVRHLCRIARISRILNTSAWTVLTRPWDRQLCLQPYWDRVNDAFLGSLSRTTDLQIQHLDLSWCGSHGLMTAGRGVMPLLAACGANLTSLRLVSCPVVDDSVLGVLSVRCPNLTDLDLSGCSGMSETGVGRLLPLAAKLRRLVVVRCPMENGAAIGFFNETTSLQHVDVSGCCKINPGLLFLALSNNARLQSVHVRFRPYVTLEMLQMLSFTAPHLQELDLTKSYRSDSVDSLHTVLPHWPGMRELLLGGARSISARDVASMWEFCPLLERVDISGAQSSNWYSTLNQLLTSCPNIVYLDVSYIDVRLVEVDNLRNSFHQVKIKQDRFRI